MPSIERDAIAALKKKLEDAVYAADALLLFGSELHHALNSSGDRIALLQARTDDSGPSLRLAYCNDEFYRAYENVPLARPQPNSSEEVLTTLGQAERNEMGFLSPTVPLDLELLLGH